MRDDLLNEFFGIDDWFKASLYYPEGSKDEDKRDILEILLFNYAELGELIMKKEDGEFLFIHPFTHRKLIREAKIYELLK